jgi:predicted transposase YdaD
MATKSKRLPLTLDPELGKLIEDIAELRGIKQTRVVTEILEESKPQLMIIRDALTAIKNNEKLDLDQVLSKMLGDSFANLSDAFKGLDSD